MGFSYRKSFKAGPIRITASKSGISYSAKVGGTRVTKRANGRTTTSTKLPGGSRYTTSSGGKKAAAKKPSTAKPRTPAPTTGTSRSIAPMELQSLYQETYADALLKLRSGEETGAALRGRLWNKGIAHPKILQAVTDAERAVAREVKDRDLAAKQGLALHAAQMLENGNTRETVIRWLKRDKGIGFMERRKVMRAVQRSEGGRG